MTTETIDGTKRLSQLLRILVLALILMLVLVTSLIADPITRGNELWLYHGYDVAFAIMCFQWGAGTIFISITALLASLIDKRRHHRRCVILSMALLPFFPIGTALGGYSLSVLQSADVARLFDTTSTTSEKPWPH